MIYYQVILTVHQSRYEDLPISSSLHRNNMPKVSHLTPFTFWDMHIRDIWNVCLQTYTNNRTC